MKKISRIIIPYLFIGVLTNAYASNLEWRGFASVGFQNSFSDATYQGDLRKEKPDFSENTLLGLNISNKFTDDSWAVAQLISEGDIEDFKLNAQWMFIAHRITSNNTLKLGKQKFPIWLVSEYQDVGYAYTWVRPPEELYGINDLDSFTGASFENKFKVSDEWELTTLVYGGRTPIHYTTAGELNGATVYSDTRGSFEQLIGTELKIENLKHLLRLSYAHAKAEFDIFFSSKTASTNLSAGGTVLQIDTLAYSKFPIVGNYEFWSLGYNYKGKRLEVLAEYGGADLEGYFPSHAGYLSLAYELDMVKPYFVFAHKTNENNKGRQTGLTLGLSKLIDSAIRFKMEWKGIRVGGGNGLFSTYPGDSIQSIVRGTVNVVF